MIISRKCLDLTFILKGLQLLPRGCVIRMKDNSGRKEGEVGGWEEGGDPGSDRSGLIRDLFWWKNSQDLVMDWRQG